MNFVECFVKGKRRRAIVLLDENINVNQEVLGMMDVLKIDYDIDKNLYHKDRNNNNHSAQMIKFIANDDEVCFLWRVLCDRYETGWMVWL